MELMLKSRFLSNNDERMSMTQIKFQHSMKMLLSLRKVLYGIY